LLDRPRAGSYIAACVVLVACRGPLTPLVPEPLAPVAAESVVAWAGAGSYTRPTALRFHWHYRDDRRSGGGRGMARIAPPDSLRVDWAAVLGLSSGAAVVVGDSLRWADPADKFPASVPPAIQLAWTALGVVRPPRAASLVSGGRDTAQAVWRYAEGRDTLDFRLRAGSPRSLEAEWRREGRIMARSRTMLGPDGLPQSVRVDAPEGPARFELTIVGVDSAATFAPALWRSRR
jgi:hypothetical protein